MKKRILAIFMVATTILSLIGCGNQSKEVADATASNAEQQTEEAVEEPSPTVAPEEKEEPADIEEEVVEESSFEFTEEYALNKISRFLEAYKEFFKPDHFNDEIPWQIKSLDVYDAGVFCNASTSDGFSLYDVSLMDSYEKDPTLLNSTHIINNNIFAEYFNNYVNNNGEYYDLVEYISNHTKEELENLPYYVDVEADKWNNNNYYLMGTYWLNDIYYMKPESLSTNKILYKEDIDQLNCTKQIIKSGKADLIDIEYLVSIVVNDQETGLYAAFDKDGNLINIIDDVEEVKIEEHSAEEFFE